MRFIKFIKRIFKPNYIAVVYKGANKPRKFTSWDKAVKYMLSKN